MRTFEWFKLTVALVDQVTDQARRTFMLGKTAQAYVIAKIHWRAWGCQSYPYFCGGVILKYLLIVTVSWTKVNDDIFPRDKLQAQPPENGGAVQADQVLVTGSNISGWVINFSLVNSTFHVSVENITCCSTCLLPHHRGNSFYCWFLHQICLFNNDIFR